MTGEVKSVPSISVSYARTGNSTKANALGMRPMQERAYEKRGEQYLLIKSPVVCIRTVVELRAKCVLPFLSL